MKVRIYDCDDWGGETLRCIADLADAFPDPEDGERAKAERELRKSGRYWAGGGAAPLVLLVRLMGDDR